MIGISVIICCYNSSTRIKPTLEHLANQENINSDAWEIILVDNASEDNTLDIAHDFWDDFGLTKPVLRTVSEPRPGLSNARRKGIESSKFEYIIFCDDDNWLNNNYLSIALNIMVSNCKIGILGGYGIPVFELEEPPFYWKNQFHALATGPQYKETGDITLTRGVVYGAGMVVNKSAYNDLIDNYDFEFLVSDRIGDQLISGGDHELCLALKRIRYKIYWNEDLLFQHYIPARRTTINYYKKLFLGFGMSQAILISYRLDKKNFNKITNNFLYLSLRYTKNIFLTWAKLCLTGYYLKENKYSFVDSIHFLYQNIGSLLIILKHGNKFKNEFLKNKIFTIET